MPTTCLLSRRLFLLCGSSFLLSCTTSGWNINTAYSAIHASIGLARCPLVLVSLVPPLSSLVEIEFPTRSSQLRVTGAFREFAVCRCGVDLSRNVSALLSKGSSASRSFPQCIRSFARSKQTAHKIARSQIYLSILLTPSCHKLMQHYSQYVSWYRAIWSTPSIGRCRTRCCRPSSRPLNLDRQLRRPNSHAPGRERKARVGATGGLLRGSGLVRPA